MGEMMAGTAGDTELKTTQLNEAKSEFMGSLMPWTMVLVPLMPAWWLASNWDWHDKNAFHIIGASLGTGLLFGLPVGLALGIPAALPAVATASFVAFVLSATGVGLIVMLAVALIAAVTLFVVRHLEKTDYFAVPALVPAPAPAPVLDVRVSVSEMSFEVAALHGLVEYPEILNGHEGDFMPNAELLHAGSNFTSDEAVTEYSNSFYVDGDQIFYYARKTDDDMGLQFQYAKTPFVFSSDGVVSDSVFKQEIFPDLFRSRDQMAELHAQDLRDASGALYACQSSV